MHSESDFWAAYEQQPDDHHLLAVFSDYLQEQGDERWQGMRALSLMGWVAYRPERNPNNWTVGNYNVPGTDDRSAIPDDWYHQTMPLCSGDDIIGNLSLGQRWWTDESLVALVSEVCRAFLRLPVERRTELLTGVTV